MKSIPSVAEHNTRSARYSMAERLGLGPEVRELKLGPSFTNNKSTAFHTLKCKYPSVRFIFHISLTLSLSLLLLYNTPYIYANLFPFLR